MEEPVSLAPLDPEEALRALLGVRPGEDADEATDEEKDED